MSDNWVVQNLEKALNVWNDKLSEIWQLITQSPTSFKGGTLWTVVSNIHGTLQAIGYALLVLFWLATALYRICFLSCVLRRVYQRLLAPVGAGPAKGEAA